MVFVTLDEIFDKIEFDKSKDWKSYNASAHTNL